MRRVVATACLVVLASGILSAVALHGRQPWARPQIVDLTAGATADAPLTASAPPPAAVAPSDPAAVALPDAARPAAVAAGAPTAVAPEPFAAFTPPAYTTTGPSGPIWAVVIGINDYPGSTGDLADAVTDAADMHAALNRYGIDDSHIVDFRDQAASAAAIAGAVDWLATTAGPDATAVFFYAGHIRKIDSDTEAIIAADGELVTDQALADRLAGLASADAWFVLAACYAGGFTELLGPGRVLTAAADADSLAYESSTYGRSYLGEYLVNRALVQGQTAPTVQSAVAYAQANLAEDHPERMLTQFDSAGHVINLDRRTPPTSPNPNPSPNAPPTSPSPPPAPGTPPRCTSVLGLLCP